MEKNAVAKTFNYLLEESKMTVSELSQATGIPPTTLYSMAKKQTNQADLGLLKTLSEYFHKDVSIFFGVDDYKEPIELTDKEKVILTIFRSLNQKGQSRLSEYASDLGNNPNMKNK